MTTTNPSGWCPRCQQNVLLTREEIDTCLAVVLLIFTAGIGLLIYLAIYQGISIKPNVSGSLCWSAVTYPLVTGNFNVTMGDPTARRHYGYDPNELIVSFPYRMVPLIVDAMEYSTAGKGKPAPWFEQAARL